MASLVNTLDSYWLWREISLKLNLSNPSYKYWKKTESIKLNNKYIFLKKKTLPEKYTFIENELTDLSGYIPVNFAADQLHVNSHLFTYDKMRMHDKFEYKFVNDIKFVNIKRFFSENGIRYTRHSIFEMGKMKDLEITIESRLYRLSNDYGIVVYD